MTKPIQIKNLTIGAGIPKICVPLTGTTREKICQEAEDAKKAAADLVEWRADFFEELMNPEACQNVLEALAEILGETPLLFTIRTSEEGGNITISLEDYAACNINIAKGKKADLVDVEVMSNSEEKKKLVAELQKEGVKVIASSHDFHKTDSQEVLLKRFREMEKSGADIENGGNASWFRRRGSNYGGNKCYETGVRKAFGIHGNGKYWFYYPNFRRELRLWHYLWNSWRRICTGTVSDWRTEKSSGCFT